MKDYNLILTLITKSFMIEIILFLLSKKIYIIHSVLKILGETIIIINDIQPRVNK